MSCIPEREDESTSKDGFKKCSAGDNSLRRVSQKWLLSFEQLTREPSVVADRFWPTCVLGAATWSANSPLPLGRPLCAAYLPVDASGRTAKSLDPLRSFPAGISTPRSSRLTGRRPAARSQFESTGPNRTSRIDFSSIDKSDTVVAESSVEPSTV